jgi:hypothetical protein
MTLTNEQVAALSALLEEHGAIEAELESMPLGSNVDTVRSKIATVRAIRCDMARAFPALLAAAAERDELSKDLADTEAAYVKARSKFHAAADERDALRDEVERLRNVMVAALPEMERADAIANDEGQLGCEDAILLVRAALTPRAAKEGEDAH